MRIEYKLKTPECISKKFHGKTLLKELDDELMIRVFEELTEYYIFEPYNRWKEKNKNKLRSIVKRTLTSLKNGQNWKLELLEELRNAEQEKGIPLLLDLDDLYDVLKGFPDKSGHVSRRCSGFKFRKNDVFLQKDREKYLEILDNLCIALDNTKNAI